MKPPKQDLPPVRPPAGIAGLSRGAPGAVKPQARAAARSCAAPGPSAAGAAPLDPPDPQDPPPPPRLLQRLREAIRVRHYSIRTESSYVDWVRRFIIFSDKRHPSELGASEVTAFLTHLAVERGVAPATQNQAKSAILFLYRVVLGAELAWLDEVVAARERRRLPVVLTPGEVRRLLDELNGTMGLLAALMYGTGMRVLEVLRLRVKDVGFENPA